MPAVTLRRVMRGEFDCDLRFICGPPGQIAWPYPG
jgi:hypothetical protein